MSCPLPLWERAQRGNRATAETLVRGLLAERERAPVVVRVAEGGEFEILDRVVGVLERQRPFRAAAGIELEDQLLLHALDEITLLRLQLEHGAGAHQLIGEAELDEAGR